MAFNRNIYNARYDIEQDILPSQFFETPKDVLASVLEPGNNAFYKLYRILIERAGERFPYDPEDFASKCFRFEDGTLCCFVTVPEPESVLLCAHLVYVFAPDLSKMAYFTVETDEFIGCKSYRLCSVDRDGKHKVYGSCSGNVSEIVADIRNIYKNLS